MNTTSKIMSFSLYAFTILIFATISLAQESCEAIVQQAIETASANCEGLRRNQACYGNVTIDAEAAADVEDFTFDAAGDITNVSDIASMRLSSQVADSDGWGISLMYIQASLPNNTNDAVTIVMFGNVAVDNAVVGVPTELTVIGLAGVNIRRSPVNGAVIGSLATGQETVAIGRNADSSWVQVEIPETNDFGWIAADLISGDDDTLPIIEVGESLFQPMQAFYLSSESNVTSCGEIVNSGLLIQTPQGVGSIELEINEVRFVLGSTAYLQINNDILYIYLLEGSSTVQAENVSQALPAGTFTAINLNPDGIASSAPAFPQPYDLETLSTLPLALLPDPIEIAEPLQPEDIVEVVQETESLASGSIAREGWYEAALIAEGDCTVFGDSVRWYLEFADSSLITTRPDGTFSWGQIAPGVYDESEYSDLATGPGGLAILRRFTVISQTEVQYVVENYGGDGSPTCTLTYPLTWQSN